MSERTELSTSTYADTTIGKAMLLSSDNFDDVIRGTPGPVAVEFINYSCGYCIKAQPIVEALAKELAGRVTIFQVESHLAPDLFARFRADTVPLFVMFQNGVEVDRGGVERITHAAIREVITGPFQE